MSCFRLKKNIGADYTIYESTNPSVGPVKPENKG